jgi:hypothetical protein
LDIQVVAEVLVYMDIVGKLGHLALLENGVERLAIIGSESWLGRLGSDGALDALCDMSSGVFAGLLAQLPHQGPGFNYIKKHNINIS